MNRVLAALASVAVIAAAVGCGTSGKPTAAAPSVCTELGGALGPDQLCKVHASAADYTLDMSFPVDYPEQQAVADYLKRNRDDFVDYVKKYPPTGRPAPYSLGVKGETYRSGTSESGTQSLVFDVDDDEGMAHEGHPDTSYDVFNYDLGKHAPITLDTLFKPGVNPVDVLAPIAAPILTDKFGAELIPALHEAGLKAYQNFAITDDAVIFFLGESQLRVSNSGPFQFSVPRAKLDSTLAIPPVEPAPPCGSGQVAVTVDEPVTIGTHRAVLVDFALAAGASRCALTGYPGVDTGAGGPLVHAERTVSGYLGGLPNGAPTTVTISAFQQAHAVVEGDVVDTIGNPCPTYTQLLVTVPDTTDTSTVAATLDACSLTVHPIGSDL
jgi:Protein of unknown function (DUF4232)